MQTPTVGRIVRYTLSAADCQEINNQRAVSEDLARRSRAEHWPAPKTGDAKPLLVTAVDDAAGTVSGQVFLDGADVLFKQNARIGVADGQWKWPKVE